MIETEIKVWACGCIETSEDGLTSKVYGTAQCARHPDLCDELKDFYGGKVPDFEIRLAAEYDVEV